MSRVVIQLVTSVFELNGAPAVHTGQPSVQINDFSLSLSGGASWLYNFIISLFDGSIKGDVQSSIAQALQQGVNQNANQALQTLPVIEPINSYMEIDYSLVSNITYTTTYLTTSHKGEFYDIKQHEESPYVPVPMPDSVDATRQLQLLASAYFFNSAGFVLQQANQLHGTITPAMIPPKAPVQLNTSDLAWNLLAPQLATTFPNMAMQVWLYSTAPPIATITSSGASVQSEGEIHVQVLLPNRTLVDAFVLNGTAHCSANATVVKTNVSVQLTYLYTNFSLMSSNVGPVEVKLFNTLIDQLAVFVVTYLNTILEPGFVIPTVDGVQFVQPEVRWQPGFVLIATDIVYKPPQQK